MPGTTRGKRDARSSQKVGKPAGGRGNVRSRSRSVSGKARTSTARSPRRSKAPPRITGRKKGNLHVSLAMWRLRVIKNKLFYIGYRLYPAYIFTTGLLIGMVAPTYLWSVEMPIDVDMLYISLLIVALLLVYYTYRWMAWKMAVKRYYARYRSAGARGRTSGRRSYGRPVRRVVATRGR